MESYHCLAVSHLRHHQPRAMSLSDMGHCLPFKLYHWSCHLKESLKSPNKVVNMPCNSNPIEGRRVGSIHLRSGEHSNQSTIGHCGHAHLNLGFKNPNPHLVDLNLNLTTLEFTILCNLWHLKGINALIEIGHHRVHSCLHHHPKLYHVPLGVELLCAFVHYHWPYPFGVHGGVAVC